MTPKYNVGDKVKIVNYGHAVWENKEHDKYPSRLPLIKEDKHLRWVDMSHEVIGQSGIVVEVKDVQGTPNYAIDGIKGKHAWYTEDQMQIDV